MFLAVEGAARILNAAKAFFGMGASNDAVLAVKCVVAANPCVANLSGAHGV